MNIDLNSTLNLNYDDDDEEDENNYNLNQSNSNAISLMPTILLYRALFPPITETNLNNILIPNNSNLSMITNTLIYPSFNDIMNESLYDEVPIKNLLSEEGKNQIKEIKITNENINKFENMKCPITFLPFEIDDLILELPCNHYFQKEAINTWLNKEKAECPICRFKLYSYEFSITK